MFLKKLFPLAAALMLILNSAQAQTVVKDAEKFAAISEQVANYMKPLASIVVKVKVDSAIVNGKNLDIHFSKLTSDYYFRDNIVGLACHIVVHKASRIINDWLEFFDY